MNVRSYTGAHCDMSIHEVVSGIIIEIRVQLVDVGARVLCNLLGDGQGRSYL